MRILFVLLILAIGAAGAWFWYAGGDDMALAAQPAAPAVVDPDLQRMVDGWREEDAATGPSDWERSQLQRVVDARDAHLRRLWDAGAYHLRVLEQARRARTTGQRESAQANARSAVEQARPLRAVILDLHRQVVRSCDRMGLAEVALPTAPEALRGTAFDLGDGAGR